MIGVGPNAAGKNGCLKLLAQLARIGARSLTPLACLPYSVDLYMKSSISFAAFKGVILGSVGGHPPLDLSWKDEDGDPVLLANEEELRCAMDDAVQREKGVLQLTIRQPRQAAGLHRRTDMPVLNVISIAPGQHVVTALPGPTQRKQQQQQPRRAMHFCLDNSGSMGRKAERAKNGLARTLDCTTEPSSFVAFESNPTTISRTLMTAQQMVDVVLPRQGGTNIGSGVQAAWQNAITLENRLVQQRLAKPGEVHHIVVLLTDGAHASGPRPEDVLPTLKAMLPPRMSVAVIVVGFTSASQTNIAALAKEQETLPLPNAQPIHYCTHATEAELDEIAGSIVAEIKASSTQRRVLLSGVVPETQFLLDFANQPTADITTFLPASALVVSKDPPTLLAVDGAICPVQPLAPGIDSLKLAVAALQPALQRARTTLVALHGGTNKSVFRAQVTEIKRWIRSLEAMETSLDPAAAAPETMSVAARNWRTRLSEQSGVKVERAAKKAIKGSLNELRELKNSLREIEHHTDTSSTGAAAFLTGGQGKFAQRAKKRGVGPANAQEYLERIRALAPKVLQALRLDTLDQCRLLWELDPAAKDQLQSILPGFELSEELEAAAQDTKPHRLLDHDLPEALDQVRDKWHSYISLATAREQYEQWCDPAVWAMIDGTEFASTYECICLFGFPAHPIVVPKRSSVVQMNPFALPIDTVGTNRVDSTSLCSMLRRDDTDVRAMEGFLIHDLYPVIDCLWPRTSKLLLQAGTDILTSVVVCRDLDMYQGREQKRGVWINMLLALLRQSTEVSLRVALTVACTIASQVSPAERIQYKAIQQQWLDGQPLIERNGINHTHQLLIASIMHPESFALSPKMVTAICNEVVSRRVRIQHKVAAGSNGTSTELTRVAWDRVRRLLSITTSSAPQPTGVLELEPPRAEVACDDSFVLTPEQQCACEKEVVEVVADTIRGLQFAKALAAAGGGRLGARVEKALRCAAVTSKDPDDLKLLLGHLGAAVRVPVHDMLGAPPGSHVYAAMVAQASRHYCGALRDQPLPDVFESEATLKGLACDARMCVYDAAVVQKTAECAAMQKDLVFNQAMRARARLQAGGSDEELNTFLALCNVEGGPHKQKNGAIWSLARVAKGVPALETILLAACNEDFAKGPRWAKLKPI